MSDRKGPGVVFCKGKDCIICEYFHAEGFEPVKLLYIIKELEAENKTSLQRKLGK